MRTRRLFRRQPHAGSFPGNPHHGFADAFSVWRKQLWHLRHGGLAELRAFKARHRATSAYEAYPSATAAFPFGAFTGGNQGGQGAAGNVGSRIQARRGRAGRALSHLFRHSSTPRPLFPDWPIPAPEDYGFNHDLTVAVIADEFTQLALQYEWRSIPVTPDDWRHQLDANHIDLVFVESAWHGNNDAWRYRVIGAKTPSPRLQEFIAAARAAGIPTVFWNKEDPAHYQDAIATAKLFDYVFTTDQTLLDRYRTDLGHNRVGVMAFAAQPAIHNPIRLTGHGGKPVPLRDVAFAGMYFAHKYPERRLQMDTLLGAALDAAPKLDTGLDIFSRFLGDDAKYQFPAPYDQAVRGSLTYPQMLSAYRAYRAFINVNSVVTSPSMMARRIFEITASGTPVVTMPTPATDRFLPAQSLATVTGRTQAAHVFRALCGNPDVRDRMTYVGQRAIWLEHTYTHRVDAVLDTVGLEDRKHRPPVVSPMISTIRPDRLPHVLETLSRQRHVTMRPMILTHGFTAPTDARARARDLGLDITWIEADAGQTLGDNYNLMIDRAATQLGADFIAKMDDDDIYGDFYVFDAVMAARFSQADVVGKRSSFMYLEAEDVTVLRFPGWDHRFTSFVAGPTIVASIDVAREVRFPSATIGEDSAFLSRVLAAGGRIYSASRFGFVQRRTAGEHTWDIQSSEVLANGQVAHWGPPNQSELP